MYNLYTINYIYKLYRNIICIKKYLSISFYFGPMFTLFSFKKDIP